MNAAVTELHPYLIYNQFIQTLASISSYSQHMCELRYVIGQAIYSIAYDAISIQNEKEIYGVVSDNMEFAVMKGNKKTNACINVEHHVVNVCMHVCMSYVVLPALFTYFDVYTCILFVQVSN